MEKPITASHLYDFAVCEHRVALDFGLDRSQRTPPDEAQRLLFEKGLEHERAIAARLGFPRVEPRPADPAAAFRETLGLMREGAAGIYQGVLIDGRRLAIPDLLRREQGGSSLGSFHYVPGDIKSGLEPRTDQVLQVVFAARILARIQGREPSIGFLLLGDGREERFDIAEVGAAADIALASVEAIASGARETFPFHSTACERCRWKGVCLPALQEGPDLSFVHGMTRARKRRLAKEGVGTARALAALDPAALASLEERGGGFDELRQLQRQAQSLLSGQPIVAEGGGGITLPAAGGAEHYLVAESDPLDGGEPFLLGWGARTVGARTERGTDGRLERVMVRVKTVRADSKTLIEGIVESLSAAGVPIFHFGPAVPRAVEMLADGSGLDPAVQGRIEGRLFDLARVVRAGGYLPVRRYRFEEVAAVLSGRPLPSLEEPEDAPFVWFENQRLGVEGDWAQRLEAHARGALERLVSIKEWVGRRAGTRSHRA